MENINFKENYSKFFVSILIDIQIICFAIILSGTILLLYFIKDLQQGGDGLGIGMMLIYPLIFLFIVNLKGKNYSKKIINEYNIKNEVIPKQIKILKITSSLKIIIFYVIFLVLIKILFF